MRWLRRIVIALLLLFAAAGAGYAQTVACAADDSGEKHYCTVDTRYGARLVKQTSASACTEGTSWGYDEEGIWVDKGCAGEFAFGGGATAVGQQLAAGQKITCSSEGDARKYCRVATNGAVQLVKQLSATPCTQGTGWGFDDKGIWVNKGCSAEFVVGVAGHPSAASEPARRTVVECSSDDGRRNICEADTKWARVSLAKQMTAASCVEGSTWGFDAKGIWVDRGCRGQFVIQKQAGFGGQSCEAELGKAKSKELVSQCLQVSPATHPPCDAQNSCELIREEVRRSCLLIGAGAPKYCGEYK